MGVVRLLLAVAVVIDHTHPVFGFQPLGGLGVVQTFFLISGFYMALVLNEKYRGPGSYRLFLSNRLLRIYPAYWVVAAATILIWSASAATVGDAGPLRAHRYLGNSAHALVRVTDVTIVGQELPLFLRTDDRGRLHWTTSFGRAPQPQLWQFALAPQAWSLSLEILFYAIAPALVRRPVWVLIACVAASLGLRILLVRACGLSEDPWINRFFPCELALFLGGALAYRTYRWLRAAGPPRAVALWVGAAYVAVLLAFQFCPPPPVLGPVGKVWILHVISWLAIPWLVLGTANSRVDRYVGGLSFPVYLVHWAVIIVFLTPAKAGPHARTYLESVASYPNGLFTSQSALLIVLASLAAAVVLHHGVCVPIERWRQARARETAGRVAATGVSLKPAVPCVGGVGMGR